MLLVLGMKWKGPYKADEGYVHTRHATLCERTDGQMIYASKTDGQMISTE
jgi:hypothetical protein